MGRVRRAVAATGAVEVDLDGVPGLVLSDDLGDTGARALGGPAPRARPDDHGLDRPRLLPRPPPSRCSTATAAPARPSGGTAASSAAGPSAGRRGRPAPPEDVGADAAAVEAEAARLTTGSARCGSPPVPHPPGARAGRLAAGPPALRNSTSAVSTTPAVRPAPTGCSSTGWRPSHLSGAGAPLAPGPRWWPAVARQGGVVPAHERAVQRRADALVGLGPGHGRRPHPRSASTASRSVSSNKSPVVLVDQRLVFLPGQLGHVAPVVAASALVGYTWPGWPGPCRPASGCWRPPGPGRGRWRRRRSGRRSPSARCSVGR